MALYNFNTRTIGPYKLRHVRVSQGIDFGKWQRGPHYKLRLGTPRRRISRVEITREGKYVWSTRTMREAVRFCRLAPAYALAGINVFGSV